MSNPMEITTDDHLTQIKHLIVWKSWWKLYRLGILFKGQIPTEEQNEWKIGCIKDGLNIYTSVFGMDTTSDIVVTPLRSLRLYEVAWSFLKQYPFNEDAFTLLHPFVSEFEDAIDFDRYITPRLIAYRDIIQEEHNNRINNALVTSTTASIYPENLFENAERLFYISNLLVLAHKTCVTDLLQDTWNSNNLYLERAPCYKKLEAVKRLYSITQEIATRPNYHPSDTKLSKRSELLNPVLIAPILPTPIVDPNLETRIIEAKRSAEVIMESNTKGHVRRQSGVSANVVMDSQNNKIGVGVMIEKKLRKISTSSKTRKNHGDESSTKTTKYVSLNKNELEFNTSLSSSSSSPDIDSLENSTWGSTVVPEELPRCFLDLFVLINEFTTSCCDHISRKSSPPPSPKDYIDNYITTNSYTNTTLNANFNAIISNYVFANGCYATQEMRKVFLNVEVLTLMIKTINSIMNPSDALSIEENAMRIIRKKMNITTKEEFINVSDDIKTEANHLGVFFHFAQNFRTLLTQAEDSYDIVNDSPTVAYKQNMYRLATTYIKELVRNTIEAFIGRTDDSLFTPRTSLSSRSNPSLPTLPPASIQRWKRVTVSDIYVPTKLQSEDDIADEANSTD